VFAFRVSFVLLPPWRNEVYNVATCTGETGRLAAGSVRQLHVSG